MAEQLMPASTKTYGATQSKEARLEALQKQINDLCAQRDKIMQEPADEK